MATSVGRPDGLEQFEADVSACPFAFDVLDGAVLVPAQITACVFKAADCQTSPGGLWGPDATELQKDAATIEKRRSDAEKAMGKALHAIEERAKDNPDAENLVRDQNGFAGARDDACRGYVKESTFGYCAASLTEARAALLEARLAALLPGAAAKPGKTAAETKKKKEASRRHGLIAASPRSWAGAACGLTEFAVLKRRKAAFILRPRSASVRT